MAGYLDKVQVNSALVDNTKLSLDHEHITTGDFFQANVSYLHETVPGEKININMESFARLNPLVVPTFGRASMRHRAFFVPFRTIFRGWNDFITDAVHIPADFNGLSPNGYIPDYVPSVTNEALMQAFCNPIYVAPNSNTGYSLYFSYKLSNQTVSVYDFVYNNEKYNYTISGRQAIKVLESLGYKIYWDTKFNSQEFSALPLLAFAKVFMDWYFPPQYRNSATYDYIQALCNQDVQQGPITLDYVNVHSILQACMYVMYDSSYTISAWDTPNEPTPGNYSNFKIVNIDSIGSIYGSNNYTITQQNGVSNNADSAISTGDAIDRYGNMNAPFITGYVNGTTPSGSTSVATGGISEYLLHSLHAMTDYMKRHQLAGSRAMDRYLARFGKALSAEKLNRSMYLGANIQNIQIGDVMSTADTLTPQDGNGNVLGSYAGKGISYGNGSFSLDTDEFGYVIIITSIVPNTSMFQGIDRQVMRLNKLQFFTPEYDSLGVQPITSAEVLIPQVVAGLMSGNPYEQVFGFTPRYADYKVAHDQLTGNFRVPSINGGSEELPGATNTSGSWHLMRVLKPLDFGLDYAQVVHSLDYVSGSSDFSQYKRLFYNDDANAPDNFTIIHNFKIDSYVPMKPLYDTYEFEDKGKKVTLETNGVKLN